MNSSESIQALQKADSKMRLNMQIFNQEECLCEKKQGESQQRLVVHLLSHVWLFSTPWTAACQGSLFITTPRACLNSCPFCQWCHPPISSSAVPFSSSLQSFPASGFFPMSQFFASVGQSIEPSAAASVLPMNVQGWFPLGLTGVISLLSKGLLQVFSSITVWRHQLFGAQPFHCPALTSVHYY